MRIELDRRGGVMDNRTKILKKVKELRSKFKIDPLGEGEQEKLYDELYAIEAMLENESNPAEGIAVPKIAVIGIIDAHLKALNTIIDDPIKSSTVRISAKFKAELVERIKQDIIKIKRD